MNMQVTGGTTFSQINQERQNVGGALNGLDGGKHLRFKGGDTLYTHDSNKWHGIHFMNRASKHEAAAAAIKTSIDNELGQAGAGDQIFQKLGLNKKITVDDLARIATEVSKAKTFAAADAKQAQQTGQLSSLTEATKDQMHAVGGQLLQQMAELPDVPEGDLASQHMGNDYFRANAAPKAKTDALEKLHTDGAESLSAPEAAAAFKEHLAATPVMSADKLVALMTNEHVSDAVGYYTAKSTHTTKVVERDTEKDVPKRQAAAEGLRTAIDETLTKQEKADLKERIGLLKDLSALSRDKIGLISKAPEDANNQDALWAKSIAVSHSLFTGQPQTSVIAESGLPGKEAGGAARDLVTALAVHYDAIFN